MRSADLSHSSVFGTHECVPYYKNKVKIMIKMCKTV